MKKSLLSAVMLSSIALTAVGSPIAAAADDFDSQIQQQDKKIADLQNQQASAQSQIEALEGQVSAINTKAQDLLTKQDTLRKESAQLKQEIKDLQERIEKREATIQKQARETQVKNTSSNYIDAVLNADSLADAVGRIQAMSTIVKANQDLVQQQKEDKQAVEAKKY